MPLIPTNIFFAFFKYKKFDLIPNVTIFLFFLAISPKILKFLKEKKVFVGIN